jgi:hypothetical protein
MFLMILDTRCIGGSWGRTPRWSVGRWPYITAVVIGEKRAATYFLLGVSGASSRVQRGVLIFCLIVFDLKVFENEIFHSGRSTWIQRHKVES